MGWEWKDPLKDPPEVGREYITVDTNKRMIVRRYEKLEVVGTNRNGNVYVKPTNKGDFCGFVATGTYWSCRTAMANKVAYYLELPPFPNFDEDIRRLKETINYTSKRLAVLEGFKNTLEEAKE